MENHIHINMFRRTVYGNNVLGHMQVELNGDIVYECDTCENLLRIIPNGSYTVINCLSPKFQRVLPLLQDVPNRSGIRIHTGNDYHDCIGCILVGISNGKRLYDSTLTFGCLWTYLVLADNYSITIF